MNADIQVVSFDLDGTLVDDAFDQAIWFVEIPRRFAALHGLDFEEARSRVVADYAALRGHPRWTDMGFWFQRFGIGDWRPAAEALTHLIRLYPETLAVLQALKPRYRLIVVTQSEPKFYRVKLRTSDLGSYFEAVYSTPERFTKLAKDAEVYRHILSELGITPDQMLHVGDDRLYDAEIPSQMGISSLLLDRMDQYRGPLHAIRDLSEVLDYLSISS